MLPAKRIVVEASEPGVAVTVLPVETGAQQFTRVICARELTTS